MGEGLYYPWQLFINGYYCTVGSGAGFALFLDYKENRLEYAFCFGFIVSNNPVEYETLITGLQLALTMNVKSLQVFRDSLFIVN